MADSHRECCIEGCTNIHARSLFCCRSHWAALPRNYRNAIWAAFRGPGVLSVQYAQAAENAAAYLEGRGPRDVKEGLK